MLVIDTCLVSSDATYGDVIICTPEPMSKSAESNYLISKTDKEGRKNCYQHNWLPNQGFGFIKASLGVLSNFCWCFVNSNHSVRTMCNINMYIVSVLWHHNLCGFVVTIAVVTSLVITPVLGNEADHQMVAMTLRVGPGVDIQVTRCE